MFKAQVRQLASKRAERFGLEIKRVTITVSNNRRRMSVALVRPPSPPAPRAPVLVSPGLFCGVPFGNCSVELCQDVRREPFCLPL